MIKIESVGSQEVIEAIRENDGYCICAVQKIPDTKCPCKEFMTSEENGLCHCGRYKKTITKD